MSKYTDQITSEHATKPKFVATVAATTDPALDIQAVIASIPGLFDLDDAVGDQLDIVGQWVGRSRSVEIPITGVYFALDTDGVGLDEGYWQGPFDPTVSPASIPDEIYRSLLRATIALNNWDGHLDTAVAAITPLFPDNTVYLEDGQDMTITVAVGGDAFDPMMAALLTGGYLALKPMTVRIIYMFTSFPPLPVFGLDVDNEFIGGLDHGAWGVSQPVVVS